MALAVARRRSLAKPAPESDSRFRKVMDDLKRGAAKTKAHAPAALKARQAAAAAKGPANEKAAGAKSKQVDKIEGQPAKKPETDSFLALLRAEIDKAIPKTLGDTENFMKAGSAGEMKGSLKGNVAQKKNEAAGGVQGATKEAPNESGVATKNAVPLPPEAAPSSPDVNAPAGMPQPKAEAEVSLQDSKKDADAQMAEAEVTPQQLEKSNEPSFKAVLTAKDAVGKQADTAPGQFRGAEKGVLAKGNADASSGARKAAAVMVGVRGGSNSAVLTKQAKAKADEELQRKQVTDHIEGIYTSTKEKVEQKLNTLETEVGAMFDTGVDAAINGMTSYVNERLDKWKDARYDRIGGSLLWAKDKLFGLPDDVNIFYTNGSALFKKLMDALVVRVANLVEQRLKEAKAEVAKGQNEIKTYVAGLSPKLQKVGEAAQKEVAGRFEELEKSIEDKKNQLAQQLAQKYKEAFDKANAELKKIQDANSGLVTAFLDKLGEIIKILGEFKDKLMAVLKKGWDTIKLILADPIGFLGNLIAAIKLGFSQFVKNIKKHLIKGFFTWLFGALAEAGIEIPDGLPSLPAILQLVLSVLGITYERMRAKAVKLIGPTAVTVIEHLVKYVKALIDGGPKKLWEEIQRDLSDLKAMVIGAIQDYIIKTVVERAVMKLVTLFNPVGAFIQAVLAIYDTVMFLIEKAQQIMALIEAVVNSVNAIATGAIGGAANWIEQALARTIPVVIGFLAQFAGLGSISKKIKEFIQKVQARVDAAIDRVIAKAVAFVKKFVGKLTGKGGKEKKQDAPQASKDPAEKSDRPIVKVPFQMSGKSHHLIFEPNSSSADIFIASEKLPYTQEFSRAHIAIDSFKHYAGTIEDPVIKKQYETVILPRIVALQSPSVAEFSKIYKARFPKEGEMGGRIEHQDALSQVQALTESATALLADIKAWAATTGISELSAAEIDKTINEKGKAIWSARHQAIKAEITATLGGFNYKGAKIGFIGSAQGGWRKEHKGLTHFDAGDFDVDMFVVHPPDFDAAQKKKAKVVAGKIFPSALTPDLSAKTREVAGALAKKFPGIRRVASSTIVLKRSQ